MSKKTTKSGWEKRTSASGKVYYAKVKAGKKPAAKRSAAKQKRINLNENSILSRGINIKKYNDYRFKLQKEITQLEKELRTKRENLEAIDNHLRQIEDILI